jgi:hypothetical protein
MVDDVVRTMRNHWRFLGIVASPQNAEDLRMLIPSLNRLMIEKPALPDSELPAAMAFDSGHGSTLEAR